MGGSVQVITNVQLPVHASNAVQAHGETFLEKNWYNFNGGNLNIHIKSNDGQFSCYTHLHTDIGVFHASAESTELIHAVQDVIKQLEQHVSEQVEHQTPPFW